MAMFGFATEHLIQKDEAEELTRFIWPDLTAVWELAFEDYNQIPEEQRGRGFGAPPAGTPPQRRCTQPGSRCRWGARLPAPPDRWGARPPAPLGCRDGRPARARPPVP